VVPVVEPADLEDPVAVPSARIFPAPAQVLHSWTPDACC
jgi:hypothetical protein